MAGFHGIGTAAIGGREQSEGQESGTVTRKAQFSSVIVTAPTQAATAQTLSQKDVDALSAIAITTEVS